MTLTALTLSASPAGAASAGRELDLPFEGRSQRTNSGVSSLSVRTLTAHGGTVTSVAGAAGGTAVRLPAFTAASNPPLALVSVVDQADDDDLSPGTAAFRFGADFALNAQSQGSSVDNGNNLVQRGTFRAPMQYKLELDGRRPGCRVKGSHGAVAVRASRQVTPDAWYRVTCFREGASVTLTVVRLGDKARWTYRGSGAIGSLRAPSRSLPVSVGGKLTDGGGIAVRDSDQFNGRVDNAFVNVFS